MAGIILTPGMAVGDGRYNLIDYIGSGAFGEVWHSHDRDLDEQVAVKLFQPTVLFDSVVDEARLQNLSRHDHVVRVLNVVMQGPMPFIVMEYLPLRSTEDRLAAGRVSLTDAVRWARNLLDGLQHAHGRGVIHRDVKPANLLLRANDTAALSDFGLAEESVRRLIRSQYLAHTAPEMLRGDPSSVQSDIWAAGCTLYRFVTGRYPFADPAAALSGRFDPPQQINLQVPLRLTRVIERALAVAPAARYSSALEMTAGLASCGVRYCWSAVPGRSDTWQWSDGPYGLIEVTLRPARRGGFEVFGTRDLGSGPRRFCNPTHGSEARARQALRRVLLQGVAGDKPR